MDYIILGSIENEIINNNINEVKDIIFLEEKNMKSFLSNNEITPWFNLIFQTKLSDYYKIQKKNLKNELNLPIINFC